MVGLTPIFRFSILETAFMKLPDFSLSKNYKVSEHSKCPFYLVRTAQVRFHWNSLEVIYLPKMQQHYFCPCNFLQSQETVIRIVETSLCPKKSTSVYPISFCLNVFKKEKENFFITKYISEPLACYCTISDFVLVLTGPEPNKKIKRMKCRCFWWYHHS